MNQQEDQLDEQQMIEGAASGDEGEDDGDDTFREPIVDGRNITFKTKFLNQYLVCSLCMGYFRDPHTIKECLHTFCKVCISRYLLESKENNSCPVCRVSLSPYPFEFIRYDRTLASLVATIFPQMIAAELRDEQKFCEERGLPIPARVKEGLDKNAPQTLKPMVVRKLTPQEAAKSFYSDEIAFELYLDPSANADASLPHIAELDKPHIRTTGKITIAYIKKYLAQKLSLDKPDQVDVLYKGNVMGVEHSIEYILRTRGKPSEGVVMFTYRLSKQDELPI